METNIAGDQEGDVIAASIAGLRFLGTNSTSAQRCAYPRLPLAEAATGQVYPSIPAPMGRRGFASAFPRSSAPALPPHISGKDKGNHRTHPRRALRQRHSMEHGIRNIYSWDAGRCLSEDAVPRGYW